MKLSFRQLLTITISLTSLTLVLGQETELKSAKKAHSNVVPQAFTINCTACHLKDSIQVGPHFVYIQENYPKSKRQKFIDWCKNPGKNNPDMPQMPSMVHVPDDELAQIHDYILSVKVEKLKKPAGDLFVDTRRPRIVRTFLPDCGPAAILVALPLDKKLNIIWDADLCRLRYITTGEPDNFPYLGGNGNSLSKPGKKVYTENSVFKSKAKPTFLGYKINDGLPTFLYELEGVSIEEKISLLNNSLVRTISSLAVLPPLNYVAQPSRELKTETVKSKQSVILTHTLK